MLVIRLYPTRPTVSAIAENWHRIGAFVAVLTRERKEPLEPLERVPLYGSHLAGIPHAAPRMITVRGRRPLMGFLRGAVCPGLGNSGVTGVLETGLTGAVTGAGAVSV